MRYVLFISAALVFLGQEPTAAEVAGEALFANEAPHYFARAQTALQRLQRDQQSAEIIFLGGDWRPDRRR